MGGLVVDTDLAHDLLSISPRRQGSVPAPSPAQSPTLKRPGSPGETGLNKLSLSDRADNSSINNNNSNAANEVGYLFADCKQKVTKKIMIF